jgi:formylglycine-generating enzyme required for sulfatase activity
MKRTNPWPLSASILVAALVAVSAVTHHGRPDRRADPHAAETAEVYYLIGVAHLEAGEFGQAIGLLHQALPFYEDAEDKLAQALDGSVVHVPAGAFIMGSDTGDVDEGPQRSVYLDAFEIDRYEVTNVQYRRFLQATGREAPERWPGRFEHLLPGRDPDWRGTPFDQARPEQSRRARGALYPPGEALYPVAGVNWQDATDYCAWVGKRLPTEAQWEKAARGNDGRLYPWGDAWDARRANTREAATGYTQPVGAIPAGASPYGVLDMAGNVWEWVADWYDKTYYSYAPERNPQGPPSGTGERILRGGAWDSRPPQARTSYRNATHCFGPNFRAGFRCARSLSGE